MKFTYRDLSFASLSAFLGGVMGYLVSQTDSVGAMEVFGLRCIGMTCFVLPVIVYYSYDIWFDKTTNLNLFVRCIAECVAVCGYYYGFVHLSIAEASLLFYSTPIFTMTIGHFFLQEYCGFIHIICTILSICGVGVVCFPKFSFNYSTSAIIGVTGSLAGALGEAVCLAITRKITQVPPFVVGFWCSVVGALFSMSLCGIFSSLRPWECGWEATCLFSVTVFGFISTLSLTTALKSTDAFIVSLTLTTEIVWAFIIQYFLSQEAPSLMTVIGGILIGISLVLPAVKKFCSENEEYNVN